MTTVVAESTPKEPSSDTKPKAATSDSTPTTVVADSTHREESFDYETTAAEADLKSPEVTSTPSPTDRWQLHAEGCDSHRGIENCPPLEHREQIWPKLKSKARPALTLSLEANSSDLAACDNSAQSGNCVRRVSHSEVHDAETNRAHAVYLQVTLPKRQLEKAAKQAAQRVATLQKATIEKVVVAEEVAAAEKAKQLHHESSRSCSRNNSKRSSNGCSNSSSKSSSSVNSDSGHQRPEWTNVNHRRQ